MNTLRLLENILIYLFSLARPGCQSEWVYWPVGQQMLSWGLGITQAGSSPEKEGCAGGAEIILEDLFNKKRGEHRDYGDIWDRDRHGIVVLRGAQG